MTEEDIQETQENETPEETTVETWISVDEVIAFHGLKPQHLNIKKTDTDAQTKMETIVNNWIIQSEDLINTYTNRSYTAETVRPAVKNVCLRLTSNMINLAVQRRDSPIIKVNDWTIQNVPSDIFTDDLKEDLKPFVKDSSNEPNSIGVYTITGADVLYGNDRS